jgi:hypothetical protein
VQEGIDEFDQIWQKVSFEKLLSIRHTAGFQDRLDEQHHQPSIGS